MRLDFIQVLCCTVFVAVRAAMELPKFNQMKIIYPGYRLHGGKYRDKDIIKMVGGHTRHHLHNTAALRMSWLFNKFAGRHSIGNKPILLSKHGRDSVRGNNGLEYIFRNTAFGPFLAAKYGNPVTAKPNKRDHTKTMKPFTGKQGIVRFVSYHRHHAGGHVALWDCDHFYQSRDWTTEHHIINVEFWESPDSYCPPERDTTTPKPKLQKVNLQKPPYTRPIWSWQKQDSLKNFYPYRPNPKFNTIKV